MTMLAPMLARLLDLASMICFSFLLLICLMGLLKRAHWTGGTHIEDVKDAVKIPFDNGRF